MYTSSHEIINEDEFSTICSVLSLQSHSPVLEVAYIRRAVFKYMKYYYHSSNTNNQYRIFVFPVYVICCILIKLPSHRIHRIHPIHQVRQDETRRGETRPESSIAFRTVHVQLNIIPVPCAAERAIHAQSIIIIGLLISIRQPCLPVYLGSTPYFPARILTPYLCTYIRFGLVRSLSITEVRTSNSRTALHNYYCPASILANAGNDLNSKPDQWEGRIWWIALVSCGVYGWGRR